MAFCTNCGQPLSEDAKFCSKCGVAIESSEENHHEKTTSERKDEYAGVARKCPNCGGELNSFVGICPYCKHEIGGIDATKSARELSRKIELIDAKQVPQKQESKSFFKRTFGKDFSDDDDEDEEEKRAAFEKQKEKQKESVIKTFPVPNTKEDLMEMMILSSSNIKVGSSDIVTKAWITKLEQTYQKAKIVLQGSSDLQKFTDIYNDKMEKLDSLEKAEKTKNIVLIAIAGAVLLTLLILIISGIASCVKNEMDEHSRYIEGKIQVPIASFEDKMYTDVVAMFENAGFTNVSAEKVPDLITGWISKEGEVIEVSINGDTEFSSEEYFAPDATIIVRYHGYKDK